MRPMLAKTGSPFILDSSEYIFEPKLDGYRAICMTEGRPKLISRRGHDITADYPLPLGQLPKNCIFDGELVVYDDNGNPNFQMLQNGEGETTYVIFDIIQFNGEFVGELSLLERKKLLEKNVKPLKNIQLMFFTGDGRKLFEAAKKRGLEGVVAKRKNSLYSPDVRSSDWLKIKLFRTIDCAVAGFLSKNRSVSSLALALRAGEKFLYVGQVGSGFSEARVNELLNKFRKIKAGSNGVVGLPRSIVPVRLKYVAEVKFVEFSRDKRLRSPVFIRLRTDKKPEECLLEPEIAA